MMTKEYKSLSGLLPRACKLFRSKSKNDTKSHIQDVIVFEYSSYHKGEVYVRYSSNENHFVEMISGGCSLCGETKTMTVTNVWEHSYKRDLKIHINSNDMMLSSSLENNFFELVGEMKVDHTTKVVTCYSEFDENIKYLEDIFLLRYLELPRNVMTISYAYKSKDQKPVYFLIYNPTYYFSYDKFKVVIIEDLEKSIFKLPIVDNVERFRDGGTTNIYCKENIEFHFPSPFHKNEIATFNGMEIVNVDKEELLKLNDILVKNGYVIESKD